MNKLINIVYIIIILFISAVFAQSLPTQINRIKIEGNKRLSADDIIRISNILMPVNIDDEFTFSVEDNEYVIKKKDASEKKPVKNFIHGPSIGIGIHCSFREEGGKLPDAPRKAFRYCI